MVEVEERGKWEMEHTMIETLERRHLAPYDLLIPPDLPSWYGLQYSLECDVPCQYCYRKGGKIVGGGDEGRRES